MQTTQDKPKIIDMLEFVIEKAEQLKKIDPEKGYDYLLRAHNVYNAQKSYNSKIQHEINEIFRKYIGRYPQGVS
jgi:hypothetical protein